MQERGCGKAEAPKNEPEDWWQSDLRRKVCRVTGQSNATALVLDVTSVFLEAPLKSCHWKPVAKFLRQV